MTRRPALMTLGGAAIGGAAGFGIAQLSMWLACVVVGLVFLAAIAWTAREVLWLRAVQRSLLEDEHRLRELVDEARKR
jgi:hypothetical protein